MKKIASLFVIILISILEIELMAQEIHFVNPTNGEEFPCTGGGATPTYSLNLIIHWTRSSDPDLTSYCIKLFANGCGEEECTFTSYQGNGDIPQWFYLGVATYQWRLEIWEGTVLWDLEKTAEQTITFYVKHDMSVSNNFLAGNINIDYVQKLSGSHVYKVTGQNLVVGAIDQNYGGYYRLWNQSGYYNSRWEKKLKDALYYLPISGGTPRDFNYTVASNDNGADVQGQLRKRLNNIIFQNNFVGVGNGGVIKVNSVQYNSPKSGVQVVEQNPVTGTSVYQVINGIQYTFNHWSDGSTTSSKTFYPPTDNTTYTAYYSGKPLSYSVMNTHFNDVPGQNVIIYWNDHPNTNVTHYKIWRKVKHNGIMSEPYLLATKNRGTTSYTDDEYVITRGYTDDLLYYDVRPYYSTESVYADEYYLPIFAEIVPKSTDSIATLNDQPVEFTVSCYPNPFNPVTNIRATVPEDGLLQMTIFNLLGEKVLDLNNSIVSKGIYEFSWNGIDANSHAVNSGIYIVFVKTEQQMLTQKLMLLK